jgi:hypothetical protein
LPSRSSRQPSLALRAKAGGASRDRTGDLKLAKLALSQLSYGPGTNSMALLGVARGSSPGVAHKAAPGSHPSLRERRLVGPERVERSTSRLSGVRSNHLSYEPISRKQVSGIRDRNKRTPILAAQTGSTSAYPMPESCFLHSTERKGNEGGGNGCRFGSQSRTGSERSGVLRLLPLSKLGEGNENPKVFVFRSPNP